MFNFHIYKGSFLFFVANLCLFDRLSIYIVCICDCDVTWLSNCEGAYTFSSSTCKKMLSCEFSHWLRKIFLSIRIRRNWSVAYIILTMISLATQEMGYSKLRAWKKGEWWYEEIDKIWNMNKKGPSYPILLYTKLICKWIGYWYIFY